MLSLRNTIIALTLAFGLLVTPPLYHFSKGNLSAAPLPPKVKTDAVMVFTGSSERLAQGYQFYLKGLTKKIMITGYDYPRDARPPKVRALSKKIKKSAVTIDLAARNTIENARNGAKWALDNHVKSILLITTEGHKDRAYFELRRLLPDYIKIYTNTVPGKLTYAGVDSEKSRLLCRLYETATSTSFCYQTRNIVRSLGL